MTSSSLNLLFPARLFSLSLFGAPQPRKTNGDDHHDYEDGVLYHRNCPELLDRQYSPTRAPPPPASEACKGRQRQGARHVSDTRHSLVRSANASLPSHTPADGSARLADGGSCHANTIDSCPAGAAADSNLRHHVVRLRKRRRRHALRRCCNR